MTVEPMSAGNVTGEAAPLLEVSGLSVAFATDDGEVRAVRGVSFTVRAGETLALVGESGSGKTVTARSIMGLVGAPGVVAGSIRFEGDELLVLSEAEYRTRRGATLAMIFQDSLSSLNPGFRVGSQVAEAIRAHSSVSRGVARRRAVELLERVGIPRASEQARRYPHEFSGGMRQRAMIAMAIANSPRLLIADEPTTALDVTIQAQVLDVLRGAQRETGAALLLITHDLGVVAGIADRVAVMYAGAIVEEGTLDEVFLHTRHPYTLGLLGSVPRAPVGDREPLATIPGRPPNLIDLPAGCPLAPRCAYAVEHCAEEEPALAAIAGEPGHRSACLRADELPQLAAARSHA
jgi:peptide/nickel transport system ATP-binding protein